MPDTGSFYSFRNYRDYTAYIRALPGRVSAPCDVFTIGKSVRGRDIWCVRLGREDRPGVLYNAMTHGSEYIGGDLALMILDWFADNAGRAADRILDRCAVCVIPLLNPDAYSRARWLRRAFGTAFVRTNANGVDLNRNFPVGFDANRMHAWSGASLPGAPFYRGPHPFSEPESRAFRDFVLSRRIRASISFHSSGRVIGYPYCHKPEPAPDEALLRRIAEGMQRRIKHVKYKVSSEYDLIPTSGDMDDWLYVEAGVLPFLMELGHFGFLLYRPDTWLNPFAWHNMPNPRRELDRVLPGALYLAEWAAENGKE